MADLDLESRITELERRVDSVERILTSKPDSDLLAAVFSRSELFALRMARASRQHAMEAKEANEANEREGSES